MWTKDGHKVLGGYMRDQRENKDMSLGIGKSSSSIMYIIHQPICFWASGEHVDTVYTPGDKSTSTPAAL